MRRVSKMSLVDASIKILVAIGEPLTASEIVDSGVKNRLLGNWMWSRKASLETALVDNSRSPGGRITVRPDGKFALSEWNLPSAISVGQMTKGSQMKTDRLSDVAVERVREIRKIILSQQETTPDRMCALILFSYSFEMYKEAVGLYQLVDLNDVHPNWKRRLARIERICRMKLS